MTKGQRTLIGIAFAFAFSLLMWCLIAQAFAQRAPQAYRGPVQITVQFTNAENVDGLCRMITEDRLRNREACANEQIMILPDPCTYPGRYAEVACHEIGHARGWVHREPVG